MTDYVPVSLQCDCVTVFGWLTVVLVFNLARGSYGARSLGALSLVHIASQRCARSKHVAAPWQNQVQVKSRDPDLGLECLLFSFLLIKHQISKQFFRGDKPN